MKFKVGEKVRVIDNLNQIKIRFGLVPEMEKLQGSIVTIESILGECINIKESDYKWQEDCFEKLITKKDDLEKGDIVVLHNNDELYFDGFEFVDLSEDNNNNICDIEDISNNLSDDVKEVKRPKYTEVYVYNDNNVIEMTLKEVCDALGYEIKIKKED